MNYTHGHIASLLARFGCNSLSEKQVREITPTITPSRSRQNKNNLCKFSNFIKLIMGNAFAKLFNKMFPPAQLRILMLGFWGAGKSSILHKLKLGEVVTTIPTIGFNVLTVEYKKIVFTSWNVGGRDKIRPLWRHYYDNTEALIWVVDSTNKESLNDESQFDDNDKAELNRMLAEDELKDVKLLVFANKQDLPNAMSVKKIGEKLGLNKLKNRQWHIQACSAKTGDGLYEGLDWLSKSLAKK